MRYILWVVLLLSACNLVDSCSLGQYLDPYNNLCTTWYCAAGKYYNGNSYVTSACVDCPEGSYTASKNLRVSCLFCASGTYQSATGKSVCTDCPAGAYRTETGATSCTSVDSCSAGYYKTTSQQCTTLTCVCSACTSGSYCPTGSTLQSSCPAGSYCSTTSTSVSCSAGTYCPAGSTVPIDCNAGNYCPTGSGSQTPCRAGGWSDAGASSCTYCPNGQAPVSTGSRTCAACAAGSYSQGGAPCASCSSTTYAVGTGNAACLTCGPGNYGDRTSCTQCMPGACPCVYVFNRVNSAVNVHARNPASGCVCADVAHSDRLRCSGGYPASCREDSNVYSSGNYLYGEL